MRMRMMIGTTLLLLAFIVRETFAQSSVSIEIATTNYRGSARDTSGNPHAHPSQGTMVGLRFDHTVGKARLGLRASYAEPGLNISGRGLSITDTHSGTLFETAAFLGFRVGGIGPSGAVRASMGPALHLWNFASEVRTRVGGIASMSYEWAISGRFQGSAGLEASISKSWFDAADLPSEFERQHTWRYGVGLGLRYRL